MKQCNVGKEDAKTGTCPEGGDRHDCCRACLLGVETKLSGSPCIDAFGLSSPLLEAFTNCCESSLVSSTTTTQTPSRLYTSQEDVYPGLSEENVCEAGEFCAQLCQANGKCSCFVGYELMKDGVSCRPIKRAKGSRCEENNPCDHDCFDSGTSIECTCRNGYELAADKTSCKGII